MSANDPATPAALVARLWRQRGLLWQLGKRDVAARYRGSLLGLVWAVLHPLLLLVIYTAVFVGVFDARWPGSSGSALEFALLVFVGLVLFNLVAECLTRAPAVIVSSANFVKKLVFPLELLPLAVLGAALFHALLGLAVWLVAHLLLIGMPPATALLLPLVLAPLLPALAGLLWLLAALGVYLRDLAQGMLVLVTALLFLSAVFYPLEQLPEAARQWLTWLNPLAVMIEQARAVLYWGRLPDFPRWGLDLGLSLLVAWLGWMAFRGLRRGFADVL